MSSTPGLPAHAEPEVGRQRLAIHDPDGVVARSPIFERSILAWADRLPPKYPLLVFSVHAVRLSLVDAATYRGMIKRACPAFEEAIAAVDVGLHAGPEEDGSSSVTRRIVFTESMPWDLLEAEMFRAFDDMLAAINRAAGKGGP